MAESTMNENLIRDMENALHNIAGRRVRFTRFPSNTARVPKADVVSIDLNQLREQLENLRNNSNLLIRNLSGKNLDDFNAVKEAVGTAYGTDSYTPFYNEILQYFQNVEHPVPGTVGAYFAGCLPTNTGNVDIAACTPVCAGSVPVPQDNWTNCEYKVLLAEYNGKGYTFTLLHNGNGANAENSNRALIYLNCDQIETFPGFSQAEKASLAGLDVSEVNLFCWNSSTGTYTDLTDGFSQLSTITGRSSSDGDPPSQPSSNMGLIIFLLIVLILIAIFFGWKMWYSR